MSKACYRAAAVLLIVTVVLCGVLMQIPLMASADLQPRTVNDDAALRDTRSLIEPREERNYAFTTIAGGQLSGFGRYCNVPIVVPERARGVRPCVAAVAEPALQAVIRDTCAWESLWNEHVSIMLPHPPAPWVDFDQDVVVAVVSGPRPNGCYGLAITRIADRDGVRVIHVVEGVPCPDDACTMNITNSFHFISVSREILPPHIPVGFDNRYED